MMDIWHSYDHCGVFAKLKSGYSIKGVLSDATYRKKGIHKLDATDLRAVSDTWAISATTFSLVVP